MKKLFVSILIVVLLVGYMPLSSHAADNGYNELLGDPIVVYGAQLSDDQVDQVKRLLEVDESAVQEFEVDGQDLQKYIGGNPTANMFSSVKITQENKGQGIDIQIITPENITEVTADMYKNALLTAGVEDATIEVASPIVVTGHSALTGIYKAYDAGGADLDADRMEVANDELELTTELSKKEGLDQEKITALMTEIKKEIADKKPATKEEVEEIIDKKLNDLNIELSDEDRQLLLDLFDRIKDLDIDFGKIKDQLNDITNTIKDRLDDLDLNLDEGFWQKVKNFFNDLIDKISSFFK